MTRRGNQRWFKTVQYLLYGGAGIAFVLPPNTGLRDLLGDTGFVLWNALLILGAVFGCVGVALKRRSIELCGIPGVVVGLAIYGSFLIDQSRDSQAPGIILGFAGICLGAAVGGLGRGWEIYHTGHIRERVAEQIRHEDRQTEEGLGE